VITSTTAMSEAATAVVSGLIGVIASYLGIRWKIKKDLEAKFDASLRDLRLDAYQALWTLLKALPVFARQGYPSQPELEELATSLKDWYFEQGGLYLSEKARESYFRLQRALHDLLASNRWQEARIARLDPNSYEHLRRIGSRLRRSMVLDVGTRNPFDFDAKALDQYDPSAPLVNDRKDPDEGPILREWGSAGFPDQRRIVTHTSAGMAKRSEEVTEGDV
jgi:hypothetical protein